MSSSSSTQQPIISIRVEHCHGEASPPGSRYGYQTAVARFLDCIRASGLRLRYATLQNSFPWIAPPHTPPWRNPRKGRDQILPSGNLGSRRSSGGSLGEDGGVGSGREAHRHHNHHTHHHSSHHTPSSRPSSSGGRRHSRWSVRSVDSAPLSIYRILPDCPRNSLSVLPIAASQMNH